MSDRSASAAKILIGGAVSREDAAILIEKLQEADVGFEYGEAWPASVTAPEHLLDYIQSYEGHLTLYDVEASGGVFEELEQWLEDQGIPFDRYTEAHYVEWDFEWYYSRPELDVPCGVLSSRAGGRLCDADTVIRALDALNQGDTHSALDALHQAVGQLRSIPPLPKFELVD